MSLRIALTFLVSLGLTALATSALAKGPYDGSKPLICTTHESESCIEDEACVGGDADDVNLPEFVRINIGAKKIEILDEGRTGETTKIRTVERVGAFTILQGIENGRGWTFLINDEGETVLTVTGDGVGWVAFGDCTTL